MNQELTFIFLALVIVVLGGFFFFFQGEDTVHPEYTPNAESGQSNQETQTGAESEIYPETQRPQTHNIRITDFSYEPKELTIGVGDTVIWTNYDSIEHTVTSDEGDELDSPLFSKDKTYSHTFNEAGTFEYHCVPHPYMKGKIITEF